MAPGLPLSCSGVPAPCRLDSPLEVASVFQANLQLGLGSGMVLAVPIPAGQEAEGRSVQVTDGCLASRLARCR